MAQRVGPVTLEDRDQDGDRTIVECPQEAVGFVTGKGGNFLRSIEEEWYQGTKPKQIRKQKPARRVKVGALIQRRQVRDHVLRGRDEVPREGH